MKPEQRQEVKEFNCLYKEAKDLYHDVAWKMGLSDSAFDIFYDIGILGDGCLQKDICAMSYISKQTVNSSIRKLEREGYIYLAPGKRRDMHIYLTEAGRKIVEEKIEPVVAMENKIFEDIGLEESREFLRLSKKYLDELREKVRKIFER